MATTTPRPSAEGQRQYSSGAAGMTAFAGIMMILLGTLHAFQGLVALVNDTFFVYGEEYVFKFDVTTWGWIHLIAGVVVVLAGFGLFSAATWARTVAVIVAGVSFLASFLWMPYYPLWSLVVMTLDVAVIWAVTAHGRDITRV